jgi:hypothetical protein
LVEQFDASVERLENLVRPLFAHFRCFSVHANASRPNTTLPERIGALRSRLRTRDLAALTAANTADLALHAHVAARYSFDVGEPPAS